jgi:diguanylate cyclase (GGDEF)-like protein
VSKEKAESKVEDLSSRRFQQLADENHELRSYVAEVMKRLRSNERLFAHLFELESQVLKSTDPEDLCFTLLRGLRSGFELDFVRFWIDRSSFMGGRKLDGLSERDLVWVEKGEIEQMGLARKRVWLMQLSSEKSFDWLDSNDQHLGSLALLTLGDLERPFGVLGVGSVDRDRFAPDQSTDFLQHLAQVVGLTLEHAVARERLARLAITDTLTGSHNRRFLQPHSHQPLSQWFGKDCGVACLYADVDDFKLINERHGEAAGDDVLAMVSRVMRRYVRTQDPLIRMGADEFIVLLPGCSQEKAEEIAGRIVQGTIAEKPPVDEKISISMGIAYSSAERDMAVKQIVEQADQAMYVAKALGGNRFELSEKQSDPAAGENDEGEH